MSVIPVDNTARRLDVSEGFGKMASAEVIKDAATVIADFTSAGCWVSNWVPCDAFTGGMLYLLLVAFDGTSLEVQIDHSPNGDAVSPLIAVEHLQGAPSSGVGTDVPVQHKFTLANYTAGDLAELPLNLSKVGWFRVKVKRTAGSTAATSVSASWIGVRMPIAA